MLDRTITELTTTMTKDHQGFHVQVTTTYCESSLGGGRIDKGFERYQQLTEDEARQLLEDVSVGRLPGESLGAGVGVFALF